MAETAINTNQLIVIGGSAGSLTALLQIMEHMQAPNMPPVIIVLHRKPLQDTLLTDLLAAKTRLLVKEAEEKELLKNGRVYIAPADYHLLLEDDGSIALDYSEKVNFSRPSINVTFESAAEVYRSRLTAVLLSGTNADGTAGLQQVEAAGGHIIVQEPATAEFSFMPENAINSGIKATLLTPEDIGKYINLL